MDCDLYDPAVPTGDDEDDDEEPPELGVGKSSFCGSLNDRSEKMVIADSCTEICKSNDSIQYKSALTKLTPEQHGLGFKHLNGLLPNAVGEDQNIPVNRDHSYSRVVLSQNERFVSKTNCEIAKLSIAKATVPQCDVNLNTTLVEKVVDTSLLNGKVNHEFNCIVSEKIFIPVIGKGTEKETEAERNEVKNAPAPESKVSPMSEFTLLDIPLPVTPAPEPVSFRLPFKKSLLFNNKNANFLDFSAKVPPREDIKFKLNTRKFQQLLIPRPTLQKLSPKKKLEVSVSPEAPKQIALIDIPLPDLPHPTAKGEIKVQNKDVALESRSRDLLLSPKSGTALESSKETLLPSVDKVHEMSPLVQDSALCLSTLKAWGGGVQYELGKLPELALTLALKDEPNLENQATLEIPVQEPHLCALVTKNEPEESIESEVVVTLPEETPLPLTSFTDEPEDKNEKAIPDDPAQDMGNVKVEPEPEKLSDNLGAVETEQLPEELVQDPEKVQDELLPEKPSDDVIQDAGKLEGETEELPEKILDTPGTVKVETESSRESPTPRDELDVSCIKTSEQLSEAVERDSLKKKNRKGNRSFANDSASSSPTTGEQPIRRSSRIRSLEERKGKVKDVSKKDDGSKKFTKLKDHEVKKEEIQNEASFGEPLAQTAKDDGVTKVSESVDFVKPVGEAASKETISEALSLALDIKRDEEFTVKPEKVKSRWRRNSELERGSTAPLSQLHELCDAKASATVSLSCKENVILEEVDTVTVLPVPETPPLPDEVVPVEKLPNFELIDENLYLFERKRSKSKKEVRRMVCDCAINKEEKDLGLLGCGEDCLNRLLMIECGSRCILGDDCGNKRFQKKQCARTEPFKTKKKGWGLRTVDEIPAGTFVMEYVGEVLSYPEFKQRVKQYAKEKYDHYYFMALKSDEIIDATCKGSMSRFINHSCDPNCETQKWTVNGELRIGFFTTEFVKSGEELTFDYQFQRYGREAQKCYCESSNCRGFIGEEKQISLKSNKALQKKRRSISEEKRRDDLEEDLALQEEIEKLSSKGGLRNKEDTLMFARLMVRAEEVQTRIQLLDIVESTTEPACLRLFLDYHGLPLIWSWMVDVSDESWELKMKILHVLSLLPISNKTMLLDSKVMNVVQRWALQVEDLNKKEPLGQSPPSGAGSPGHVESPEVNGVPVECPPAKRNRIEESVSDSDGGDTPTSSSSCDEKERTSQPKEAEDVPAPEVLAATGEVDGVCDTLEQVVTIASEACDVDESESIEEITNGNEKLEEITDVAVELEEKKELDVPNVAAKLLESWAGLKEVFRIPRLERQKRKEDELAAGQQDFEPRKDWESDSPHWYRDRKRARYRDDNDRDYDRKPDSPKIKRTLLPTPTLLSKQERRQLFAMEVQQRDHEEALRRQQEFEMSLLEGQADPQAIAAALLMQQQVMMEYPQEHMVLMEYPPPAAYQIDPNAFLPQPPYELLEPQIYDPAAFVPSILPDAQMAVPVVASPALPVTSPLEGQAAMPSGFVEVPPTVHTPFPDPNQASSTAHLFHQQQPPVGMVFPTPASQVPYVATSIPAEALPSAFSVSQAPLLASPIITSSSGALPPHLSIVTQAAPPAPVAPSFVSGQPPYVAHHGAPLYYVQNANAVVPLPDQSQLAMHGSLPLVRVAVSQAPPTDEVLGVPSPPKSKPAKLPPLWKTAKDDEGNIYYYHAITRQTQWDPPACDGDTDDDMDLGTPTFDEPKVHKNVSSSKEIRSSSHKRHSKKKTTADTSSELAKKIKELFRTKMSSYIVQCLNPYRKPDCKLGRIICTEDFKHLARKLTHFVMSKELKHCKNVEDFECNDNVKHKAKEFVTKYMSRYGSTYKKDKCSPKSLS